MEGVISLANKRNNKNSEKAQKTTEGNLAYPEYNDREHNGKKKK